MSAATAHPVGVAARTAADERGAVMVLGIFMCTVLVGALWYIAGIGDAIIYRERLQEAADATAFSGAVLHARGMNLLVLINLVMACVLGIRVALKVVQVALVAAGVIFLVLGFFFEPFLVAAKLCGDGVKLMQNLIDQTRTPIDDTLKVLSKVEVGIAHVVPFASLKGSYQIADKYKPVVSTGFAGTSLDRYTRGLPVEEGTTDRLCGEAGKAVGELIMWAIPIDSLKSGRVGRKFGDIVSNIVKAGPGYFCELGGGGKPPDLSDMLGSAADERCDEEKKKLDADLRTKNGAWHAACDRLGATCLDEDFSNPDAPRDTSEMFGTDKLKAADQAELRRLQGERDTATDAVRNFDGDKCRTEQKKQMKKQLNQQMPPPQKGTNGSGMTPKKVEAKWANGRKDTQMIAWVHGQDTLLKISPGLVKVGAMGNPRAGDIDKPVGADFAYAQAEFFYDCTGAWGGKDCNGEGGDGEESMWHFRWRARLRRYNTPYDDLPRLLEAIELLPAQVSFATRAGAAAFSANSFDPGNLGLKKELMSSVGTSPKTYAIH